MYPLFKFVRTAIVARFQKKLELQDQSVLQLRAGITDIDVFMELNNARYLTYMEVGRFNYCLRQGLYKIARENRWGMAVGGISMRYRRRIGLWSKFTLSTELICHDGRWFYFLQETHSDNQICSSALMKVCATSRSGLVPATEVLAKSGRQMSSDIPEWVEAWIAAESLRPWPVK